MFRQQDKNWDLEQLGLLVASVTNQEDQLQIKEALQELQ